MDFPKNGYANRRSCVTQRQVQMEDKIKNDEDVLKKMVFSFQLLVAGLLLGNRDHSILSLTSELRHLHSFQNLHRHLLNSLLRFSFPVSPGIYEL